MELSDLNLGKYLRKKEKLFVNLCDDVISDLMEIIALNSNKWNQVDQRIFSVLIYAIMHKFKVPRKEYEPFF